jgi:serine protease AprX
MDRVLDGAVKRLVPWTLLAAALPLAPSPVAATEADGAHRSPFSDTPVMEDYDPLPPNRVWRRSIGLHALPAGVDGSGVRVAVLDTGVSRVPDLGDRVVTRADLTPEGDGYDRYGHGTHMIGVVAGDGTSSGGRWKGTAVAAEVVSVKVASWNGATDVSSVLAGLEWIAAHADRYRIRVVNLSYGTDSSQSQAIDPLDHAVERLWDAGVVVVVAAGNRGDGGSRIDKPGDSPFVITVGAADVNGTATPSDDRVAPFSSHGPTADGDAKPDVLAPGITIVSNRARGSTIDAMRAAARLGPHHFKGSGTSQATAIVSGVVALMLDANPALTPDDVKATLQRTAHRALAGTPGAGSGLVNAKAAVAAAVAGTYVGADPNAGAPRSTGHGSIDSSRGNFKVHADPDGDGEPEQVSGEVDVLGRPWDADAWTARRWTETAWSTSPWAGLLHVSPGWTDPPRPPGSWSGMGWDEPSWTAKSWRGAGWTADNWLAKSWRAGGWNGGRRGRRR